jgi:hypothetical protein
MRPSTLRAGSTKDQFVLKALVDFDLVESSVIEELYRRFDTIADTATRGSAKKLAGLSGDKVSETTLTVRLLFEQVRTARSVLLAFHVGWQTCLYATLQLEARSTPITVPHVGLLLSSRSWCSRVLLSIRTITHVHRPKMIHGVPLCRQLQRRRRGNRCYKGPTHHRQRGSTCSSVLQA